MQANGRALAKWVVAFALGALVLSAHPSRGQPPGLSEEHREQIRQSSRQIAAWSVAEQRQWLVEWISARFSAEVRDAFAVSEWSRAERPVMLALRRLEEGQALDADRLYSLIEHVDRTVAQAVNRSALRYRIDLYRRFRLARDAYDARLRQWDDVHAVWKESPQESEQQQELLTWLASARSNLEKTPETGPFGVRFDRPLIAASEDSAPLPPVQSAIPNDNAASSQSDTFATRAYPLRAPATADLPSSPEVGSRSSGPSARVERQSSAPTPAEAGSWLQSILHKTGLLDGGASDPSTTAEIGVSATSDRLQGKDESPFSLDRWGMSETSFDQAGIAPPADPERNQAAGQPAPPGHNRRGSPLDGPIYDQHASTGSPDPLAVPSAAEDQGVEEGDLSLRKAVQDLVGGAGTGATEGANVPFPSPVDVDFPSIPGAPGEGIAGSEKARSGESPERQETDQAGTSPEDRGGEIVPTPGPALQQADFEGETPGDTAGGSINREQLSVRIAGFNRALDALEQLLADNKRTWNFPELNASLKELADLSWRHRDLTLYWRLIPPAERASTPPPEGIERALDLLRRRIEAAIAQAGDDSAQIGRLRQLLKRAAMLRGDTI